MKIAFIFFLIFLYILAPRLNFPFPIHGGFLAVLLGFTFSYKNVYKAMSNLKIQAVLLIFIFFALYQLVFAVLYGHNPFYLLSIFISLSFSLIFSFAVPAKFFIQSSNNSDTNEVRISIFYKLMKMIVYVIFLNSLIIVVEFYFPSFRDFLEGMLVNNKNSNINYEEHAFRFRGFSASGGASLSVINAVAVWLATMLCINNRLSNLRTILLIIVICASNIFTGRTGLIFSLLFGSFFLIYKYIPDLFRNGFRSLIANISILTIVIYVLPQIQISDEILDWAFEWSDGLKTGNIDSGSTDELKTMLFMPSNPFHLMFGVGYFEGTSGIYPRTDSGYLKTLFSFGFFWAACLYFLFFKLIFDITKIDKELRSYIFPIIVFLLIVELKEPFIYQNYLSRTLLLLIGSSIYLYQQRKLNDSTYN